MFLKQYNIKQRVRKARKLLKNLKDGKNQNLFLLFNIILDITDGEQMWLTRDILLKYYRTALP